MSCAAGNEAGLGEAGELELSVLIGPSFRLELAPVTRVSEEEAEEVRLTCEVSVREEEEWLTLDIAE